MVLSPAEPHVLVLSAAPAGSQSVAATPAVAGSASSPRRKSFLLALSCSFSYAAKALLLMNKNYFFTKRFFITNKFLI